MNCGDLTVGLADGSAWEAVTTTGDGEAVSVEADAGSLEIRSTTGGFPFSDDRQDWSITLGRDVEYDLSLAINAFDGTLDLTGGQFARLEARSQCRLAGHGPQRQPRRRNSDVQLNAGSLSLLTDGETAADRAHWRQRR